MVTCLKGNQGTLHKSVAERGEKQLGNDIADLMHESLHETWTRKRHGRSPRRREEADEWLARWVLDASPCEIRNVACAGRGFTGS